MNLLIAALIAVLVGIVVKFLLERFSTSAPYADVLGLIVAVLVFLHEMGRF